ncbi:ABC transporter ATP-binding protein [Diaphorobacter sp. HDW4A]|uniref:ABC transporter ATP-binding protein n=1 Tax=Diaphorobacter sp. HDW4A TaxID=2714924 RepID=UPI0014081210|nr:ABC transporter ATP-binding protein [Diaphorobacter sp. HDW4A]QIL79492.1 ABC transporter ATP-binding protein [Diaphorobacter sp. HDW4A]
MSAGLQITGLHAMYDMRHVLDGIDLEVRAGEIVALLGRNGSGRSTLAKAIMGQVTWQGDMRWQGRSLAGLKTFEIAQAGIGYVPENRDVFPTLTVAQNLMLGEQKQRRNASERAWRIADMYAMFPSLHTRRDVSAGVLSGGEQQMLTLCRTLMGNPQLVIIDEPTEGLAPMTARQVAQHMLTLKAHGIGVLLIEQKLGIALDIADRVAVMGAGKIVFEGTARRLQEDTDVRRDWLEI